MTPLEITLASSAISTGLIGIIGAIFGGLKMLALVRMQGEALIEQTQSTEKILSAKADHVATVACQKADAIHEDLVVAVKKTTEAVLENTDITKETKAILKNGSEYNHKP